MSTVTVGVDGSLRARRAVRVAAREAALRGVPLRIASATWWPEIQERPSRDFEPPERRALADIDAALLDAADAAADILPRTAIETVAYVEDTVGALTYESRRAAMLVLGSRGLGAIRHAVLGSVSAKLAAQAACPVLVVPDVERELQAGAPVLVGVDGAQHSARALEAAFAEATLHSTSVLALHTFAMPLLAGPAALTPMAYAHLFRPDDEAEVLDRALAGVRSRYPDVPVLSRTVEGAAAHELVDAGRDALMLVLATHGHTDAMLHGSVTRGVLHHSAAPVLVVH